MGEKRLYRTHLKQRLRQRRPSLLEHRVPRMYLHVPRQQMHDQRVRARGVAARRAVPRRGEKRGDPHEQRPRDAREGLEEDVVERVPEGRSIQSDVGAKFKGVSWS
eukprot:30924-Pelagococcus_subviridis.AAC.3